MRENNDWLEQLFIYEKPIFFLLILLIIAANLKAQNKKSVNQGIENSTTDLVEFSFSISDKNLINNDLTNIISIENVKLNDKSGEYFVTASATPEQFQRFLSRNIPYKKIVQNSGKAYNMATTISQMANWDRYPTYNVYEQMMAGFAANYPTLCDIDTILHSTPSGHYRILVAKISDNVNIAENEPQFLYTSSMHGDETTGYYLMLRLINYLLTNYGVIPKVTNLVNNIEIWINPLANPDGTYYRTTPPGSDVDSSRRANLAGVDLNRNYPDPRAGQHPDGYSWQPETQAFMAFADKHHFNMAGNFHGGAELINYPWDTWTTSGNINADRLWWERVCTAYVDTARLVNPSYMSSTYADGVTEGGDWYVVTGGRQDYMNYFKYCREVTIELDVTKKNPTENLQMKWNQDYRSLLNYLQESLYGIRGVITDSCTGLPMKAKVWVSNYDQANDSSQVYSALPIGNYHKYMIAGSYNLVFSAPGYKTKTVNNVVLSNGTATILDIQLQPLANPLIAFSGTINGYCSSEVQFTNGSVGANSFIWYFGDGSTSTDINPVHTYSSSGLFTVKLKTFNCYGADSLVKPQYINITKPFISSYTEGYSCGPGQITLTAVSNNPIFWFSSPIGGSPLGSGSSFTTPVINTTTTYYSQSSVDLPYQAILGTASASTSQTGLTPFSSYYEGSREQYLILASELNALGITGNITSLSFNVTATGSYVMKNYTIKIAHTSNTTLNGAFGILLGGYTIVYSNTTEPSPGLGWKLFTFNTPFAWDGTSNILIDICHDNDINNSCNNCYGTNAAVSYTSTSFNSCFGSYADNMQSCATQASNSLTSTYYKRRPDMKLGYNNSCSSSRQAVVAYVYYDNKVLKLKMFLEGLYEGNGMMSEAKGIAQQIYWGLGIADKITIELHQASYPYNLIHAFNGVSVYTNGETESLHLPCVLNQTYYIVVKHRNSIETWSAHPVDFGLAGNIFYDFSISANKAYGNNLKPSGTVYLIWGGNAFYDEIIDGSDMMEINNYSLLISEGYLAQDVNGDGIVDGTDMVIVYNNSNIIVEIVKP